MSDQDDLPIAHQPQLPHAVAEHWDGTDVVQRTVVAVSESKHVRLAADVFDEQRIGLLPFVEYGLADFCREERVQAQAVDQHDRTVASGRAYRRNQLARSGGDLHEQRLARRGGHAQQRQDRPGEAHRNPPEESGLSTISVRSAYP